MKTSINYLTSASLLACLSIGAVFADDRTALTSFINDPSLQQAVLQTAKQSTVVVQNPCAAATYKLDANLILIQPMQFDSVGKATAGAVKFPVLQEGCGENRLLNVMTLVQQDRRIGVSAMLPGTSRADPVLQKDAVFHAVIAAGGQEANCKIGYVENTAFLEQGREALPGSKGPSWKELWTLRTCTKRMEVPMLFIPDPTGTTISAGPDKAVKVTPLPAKAP